MDTKYVDIDKLMVLYMKYFNIVREQLSQKFERMLTQIISEPKPDFSADKLLYLSRDFRPYKPLEPFILYPSTMSFTKSILHAYLSGENSN